MNRRKTSNNHSLEACYGGAYGAVQAAAKPWMSSKQKARAGRSRVTRWHKNRNSWNPKGQSSPCVEIDPSEYNR